MVTALIGLIKLSITMAGVIMEFIRAMADVRKAMKEVVHVGHKHVSHAVKRSKARLHRKRKP